jgi:LuxR family maltose regulon positive regulatory protein
MLHRRAYEWHRDHGSEDAAIGHALEAGAFDEARDVIAGIWMQTVRVGRQATVIAWLDRCPRELVRSDPVLVLIRAWTLAVSGRIEEAEAELVVLEGLRWPDEEPLPDGSTSLEASVATIRAAFPGGDVGQGYRNAVRAVELQSPGSHLRAAACWPLGRACFYRGDLEAADRWFAETAELAPRSGLWMVAASSLAYRSLIAGDEHRLEDQRFLAEQADVLARERSLEGTQGEVHLALGISIAAHGAPRDALQLLARGTDILRSLRRPVELAYALMRQAAVLNAAGDHEGARAAIEVRHERPDSHRHPDRSRRFHEGARQVV